MRNWAKSLPNTTTLDVLSAHSGVGREAFSWFSSYLSCRSIAMEAVNMEVQLKTESPRVKFLRHPVSSSVLTSFTDLLAP